MKEYCGKCGMSFRVEEPYHKQSSQRTTAVTTCSEPGCGRRFWHALTDHREGKGIVLVGIFPADAKVTP